MEVNGDEETRNRKTKEREMKEMNDSAKTAERRGLVDGGGEKCLAADS